MRLVRAGSFDQTRLELGSGIMARSGFATPEFSACIVHPVPRHIVSDKYDSVSPQIIVHYSQMFTAIS
jgi:hypothetical protein